jgi:hypothetical protein
LQELPLIAKQFVKYSIRHGANRTRIYNLAELL